MKKISLLGCGRLGFPLAIKLLHEGYSIKGSTTTESKIQKLKKVGITPFLINISDDLPQDFFKADILVLTLPYKKTFTNPEIYKNQIKLVCEKVLKSCIQHIVFTSSSSVYPKDGRYYLTSDNFEPRNKRAEVLLECEQLLSRLKDVSVISIRLGGIYGEGRKIKSSSHHQS